MVAAILGEFVHEVMPIQSAGMLEHLASGDDLEYQSRGAVGDAGADVSGIDFFLSPDLRLASEVRVGLEQIVADQHPNRAQFTIAKTSQSPRLVDLITLVPCGEQTGSAGDRLGGSVVRDRSHLAGQFARAVNVDTGRREQQHVSGRTPT